MIRPEEYNKRIVAHPNGDSLYDTAICGAAKGLLLESIENIRPCNITTLARHLGINRDRVSSTIKALDLEAFYRATIDKIKAEKAKNKARNLQKTEKLDT